MKIETFEVDTENGRKRISMQSTGKGAWVTVSNVCANPMKVVNIRPVVWLASAEDIKNLIERSNN
jgi:hypothetical protein